LGNRAFQALRIPDELALAQVNPGRWLNPSDRQSIDDGTRHLQIVSHFGLFKNSEALSKLAWFKYLSGEAEQSVQLLGAAAERQRDEGKALSLYYRGTILNRLGRYQEALTNLDHALTERDDLILARQEKGESLWHLGRKEDAVAVWKSAVQRNFTLSLANNQLAGAEQLLGRFDDAATHERQADQFTPDDPFYHWMIATRLQDLGMTTLAAKHFERAAQLNPAFEKRNPN